MRFYLITLGCAKNLVDSEGMIQLLRSAGHVHTTNPRQADALIVNTCGFLQAARQESLGELHRLARHKQPGQVLIAAGCLAQRYETEIPAEVPGVDAVLSTRHWHDVVSVVEAAWQKQQAGAGVSLRPERETEYSLLMPERIVAGASAYLKIAEGCDAPCSFCVIPAIKGRYRSKPVAAIVTEARQLVQRGVREVCLIAQDTTFYGRDRGESDGLAKLLETLVQEVPDLPWIRLLYAYPGHVTPRLIETMARHPQILPYIDMPLQHADPQLLRQMRRPTLEQARRNIAALRAAMPDVALRSTFIVGFPGEGEAEFKALLDFMSEIAFDRVGLFTYSPEPGTPAATLPDPVPPAVREERYHRAMRHQQAISLSRNRRWVGRRLDVLLESVARPANQRRPGQQRLLWIGRSFRDAPEIDGNVQVEVQRRRAGREQLKIGQIVPVLITGATEYDLQARLVVEKEG